MPLAVFHLIAGHSNYQIVALSKSFIHHTIRYKLGFCGIWGFIGHTIKPVGPIT